MRNLLKRLLNEAAEAHHIYEKGLGHEDADWAGWYADYMVKRVNVTTIAVQAHERTMTADERAEHRKHSDKYQP